MRTVRMAETKQGTKATVGCPFCTTLNRVNLERLQHRPKCGECGRPLLLDRPVAVHDRTLERVVREAEVPVLVDFYADWCGPCKVMAPTLDEFAREHQGEVLVAKLNTDLNPAMSTRFQVRSIPTLVLFAGGRERAREVGAVPKAKLEALLQSAAAG
jgi:thioredoxin 2